MPTVFISHATQDFQFARRLADDLQRFGVRVWIAPESILPGENWVGAIERGLKESSHVVVVLTLAALKSKLVKMEMQIAIAQERKGHIQVIPLDVEPCEVPPLLSSYHLVSFRRDYDAGLSQLTTALGSATPTWPTPRPVAQRTLVRPWRPVNWEMVGVIAGVIGLLIALAAWLVPNTADFLSAWLSKMPTATQTSSLIHPTPISATSIFTPVPPTSTPVVPPSETSPVIIAALNIESKLQADGTVKRMAQLSIEDLGYGDLQLTAPRMIKLGESGIVRLTIIPDSALGDLLPVSVDIVSASDPSYGISINDRIQIYPVMIAELEGVNFGISPSGPQARAVTSQSQVVWSWSVTAKAAGNQSLILAISIPVLIDQIEDKISAQLKEIPIHVYVEVTPTPTPSQAPRPTPIPTPTPTSTPLPVARQIGDQLINNSATIFTALIALVGVLAGVYASIQNSKRETDIKNLETQIQTIKGEEQKELEREIARLKSIRWWQFWRR